MTIREHLEAIRARHGVTFDEAIGVDGKPYDVCIDCLGRRPCPNEANAVAALALLDEATFGYDIDHGWREDRLVPDPGMNPELRDPDPQPDAPQAYDGPKPSTTIRQNMPNPPGPLMGADGPVTT